jgi:hypothetical protein
VGRMEKTKNRGRGADTLKTDKACVLRVAASSWRWHDGQCKGDERHGESTVGASNLSTGGSLRGAELYGSPLLGARNGLERECEKGRRARRDLVGLSVVS